MDILEGTNNIPIEELPVGEIDITQMSGNIHKSTANMKLNPVFKQIQEAYSQEKK